MKKSFRVGVVIAFGVAFWVTALFLSGCSSVRPLPPVGIQKQLGSGTVILPDLQRIPADAVHLVADSIVFRDENSGVVRHLNRSQVDTILIRSGAGGFFQGMGLGLVSAFVVGGIISNAIISSCDPNSSEGCIEASAEGILAGGTIGFLLMGSSAIYGSVRGSKVYYPRIYTPRPTRASARRAVQPAPPPQPTQNGPE